jgi:hypothetical protein
MFLGCTSLSSITIPTSVTSIDYWAFMGCTSLESITIPSSVTSIGQFAFTNCASLTSVTFESTISDFVYPFSKFLTSDADMGDLNTKYQAESGGPGTYTRPNTSSTVWTKVEE